MKSPYIWIIALMLLPVGPVRAEKAEQLLPLRELRIEGADTLHPGANLVRIKGKYGDRHEFDWVERTNALADLSVTVTGGGALVADRSGYPMNPLLIRVPDEPGEAATVEVSMAGVSARRVFPTGPASSVGRLDLTVYADEDLHAFDGLGGGVLFYDNQFQLDRDDRLYDLCFKELNTTYLHLLFRHGYEPVNDNDDWQTLNTSAFDFSRLSRPIKIVRKALERNPDLKIYVSLYSPPAWMKEGGETTGDSGLKPGKGVRLELAEYLFACLKQMKMEGIAVDYLAVFNEPDCEHIQDGMYIPDLGEAVDILVDCSDALSTLIERDGTLTMPALIFPDTLGPGAITRNRQNRDALTARAGQLDRVAVWGFHDYWNTSGDYWENRYRDARRLPFVRKDQPIWMTEWAQRYQRGDLASAVEFGQLMLNSLRLGASAWMVFEYCHPSGNQSGLISTDWSRKGDDRYWPGKAYYVFKQIANTSPEHAQILRTAAAGSSKRVLNGQVEYLAIRRANQVVVHLMNANDDPVDYQISLQGDDALRAKKGYLTGPEDKMRRLRPGPEWEVDSTSPLTFAGRIPAYSLLSLQLGP